MTLKTSIAASSAAAGRSTSKTSAFVAGGLFATALLASAIAVAIALGATVMLPGQPAEPGAVLSVPSSPAAGELYNGPLDPAERDYIRRAHSAPRPAAAGEPYNGPLDPVERDYIRRAHSVPR